MTGTRHLCLSMLTIMMTSLVHTKDVTFEERFEIEEAVLPTNIWCGLGIEYDSYADLDVYEQIEACCYTHAHCDRTILPGEEKYGHLNTRGFTVWMCDADKRFRRCLGNVNSPIADMVANTYLVSAQECFLLDENYKVTRFHNVHYLKDQRRIKQHRKWILLQQEA